MESTLGVDFEKDRPREIYDALLIYLDSTLSNRTMRLQSLHVFAGNLKIVAVVSPILYGLISVYNWFEPIFTTMLFASIAASTFCLLFIAALSASEGLYLELLLKEYWLKQTGVTE